MGCSAETVAETRRLAANLVSQYRNERLRLAIAESCTGGLLAGAITNIPGASEVLDRGFVAYSNESKQEMLHVPSALFVIHGAVSAEVAQAMAEGALNASRANCAISITGIAGPGGSLHKPEGLVFICMAHEGRAPIVRRFDYGVAGRESVRRRSVLSALEMLTLREGPPGRPGQRPSAKGHSPESMPRP